jgi:hypothetical protein
MLLIPKSRCFSPGKTIVNTVAADGHALCICVTIPADAN